MARTTGTFRRLRGSPAASLVAGCLIVSLGWLGGPHQAAAAMADAAHRDAAAHAGKARKLNPSERRAVRGGQISSPPGTYSGTPRPWAFSFGDLNGYGTVSAGSQHIDIPVVSVPGKGPALDLHLHYNSIHPLRFSLGGAATPLSLCWTHTYMESVSTSFGAAKVSWGDGRLDTYTQNMDGSYTAPSGVFDTLVQNMDGTFTVTLKGGVKHNFNSSNRLSTIVDRNGFTLTVSYNFNGTVNTVTDAASRTLTFGYTGLGDEDTPMLTSVTDPDEREFDFSYDGNYNLQDITYPAPAAMTSQPYIELTSTATGGLVTGFQDRRGKSWSISYSGSNAGEFVSCTDPASKTLTLDSTYQTLTHEDGMVESWTEDSDFNITARSVASDTYHSTLTENYTWDSSHNRLTRETARGKTWTYTYDSSGNVLTISTPDSVTAATLTYNSFSEPLTFTDGLSHETQYTYDTNGNLTNVTDPLSHQTTYGYTSGLLTSMTDANSHETDYDYDTYGNLTSLTDPDAKTTTWTYNVLSQKTSRTDALSHETDYTYDHLGRLTQITYPSGTNPTFQYDGGDLLTQFVDATGTTTRAYDDFGRLYTETKSSRTFTSGYDEVGNRTSLTDPDSNAFGYTYDNRHCMVAVTLGASAYAAYGYDADGNQTSATNPNGTTVTRTFDNEGRLSTLTNKNSGSTVLSSFSYSYNDDDLRTGVTEADSSTVTWGYDYAHRLTSDVRTGTNAYSASYTVDPCGNWSSRTVGSTTTNYTYDAADRIQSAGSSVSYAWNDDGTLASRTIGSTTTSFTWNYEQQLTGITGGLSYAYDTQGRRVSRTASSTTTTFLYDGGRVGLEKQSSTTVHSYGYGTELLQRDGETMQYDGHGDTRTVTNNSQTVTATGNYEAYGTLVGGTGSSSTPYQYGGTSGYRTDGDADLVYIGARWYDPVIGRWISADSDLGSVTTPASRNRYVYSEGDPVGNVDLTGHSIWGKVVTWGRTLLLAIRLRGANPVGTLPSRSPVVDVSPEPTPPLPGVSTGIVKAIDAIGEGFGDLTVPFIILPGPGGDFSQRRGGDLYSGA